MKVNKFNGHILIFVSLATILKSKMAANEPLLLWIPYINHNCKFPLWAEIHVIIHRKYIKYLKIYYVDG